MSDNLPLKKWGKLEIFKQFCVISQNTYSSVWSQGLLISQQWNVGAFSCPDSMVSQTVLVSPSHGVWEDRTAHHSHSVLSDVLIARLSMACAWPCAVVFLWTNEHHWKHGGFFNLESHNQTWFFEGRKEEEGKEVICFFKIIYFPFSKII